MSQRHLPVHPPAWRLDKHFQERLQRGGASLPVRPRVRAPRRRPVRMWRVAETARRIMRELALGAAIGIASVVLVVGPVGHGLGWI